MADFARRAESHPDAPALRWADQSVTYGELAAAASRFEAGLDGVGSPICVPADKSPAGVAVVVAALAAGHRVLLPSPLLGEVSLTRLCEQAGVTHVVRAAAPELDAALVVEPTGHVPVDPEPDAGLMLTTSGSTGLPKIVPLATGGVDRFLAWARDQFSLRPGATVLNYAPLNFDLCLLDVWATLAAGGCVELVETAKATDGAHLLRLLAGGRPAVIQAVPMFFRLLAEARTADTEPLDSVEHLVFTGDVLPPALLAELPELFPKATFYNIYGCTETNDSFLHEVDLYGEPGPEGLPIGRPIAGVDALIVDAAGELLDGAGTGELLVSTPFQAHRYLDARLTKEKWVAGPLGASRRAYFRSGDLVRRDETGLIWLQGRNDHQVKVRGVLTNLQEVEQVLLQHPEITEAAVATVRDEVAGTSLHAVVRRRDGSTLNSLQLRSHCAARLPRTAIPSGLRIVDRALPRTSTGKVDRNRVLQIEERDA